MCLIIVSYKVHPEYPLLIAANRDESYQRPTRQAEYWQIEPSILAGQDLEKGGSWLGMNKYGRIAAVTNYRSGAKLKVSNTSRGLLVSEYLKHKKPSRSYLDSCLANLADFDAFNLLLGDVNGLYFLNSREKTYTQLQAGFYGISNGDFDSNWPKVERAKQQIHELLKADQLDSHEAILTTLTDKYLPDDESLPDTGVGIEWERALAPIFITTKDYGTLSSSVVSVNKNDKVRFTERSYDRLGDIQNTRQFEFMIEERK